MTLMIHICARNRTGSTLQLSKGELNVSVQPLLTNMPARKLLTPVGFEPTPLRTGA
jgi:hypothetical protein